MFALILLRNSLRRNCDKVLPYQLNTTGLTHLVLAFAMIDPKTYHISQVSPEENDIYGQFMALPGTFKKVIGVGGWEHSDPGDTHYTWSEMTSGKENRGAFIDSLQSFVKKWKFSGIEIHWEWPGSSARGGNPDDSKNLVALMTELREVMGSDFSISVMIPAQYEYLKNMDPTGLEAVADWLTILTYDLHGAWDADVPGIGPKIRPHTDLAEIDKALEILWSAKVTPSKVNLGVANYGRGYTVSSKECMWYDCAFTGPSTAGVCTKQDGVLSACEIQRIISQHGLKPKLINGGAGVKEIAWDDQWIGYDDAETFELKLKLANDRCLGGTALWALDYAACDGSAGSLQPGNSVAPTNVPVPTNSVPGTITMGSDSSTATSNNLIIPTLSPIIGVSSGEVLTTTLPSWIQSSIQATSPDTVVVGPGNSASTWDSHILPTTGPIIGVSSSDVSTIPLSSWIQSSIQATASTLTSPADSQVSSESSPSAHSTDWQSSLYSSQATWSIASDISSAIPSSGAGSAVPSWNSVNVTYSSQASSTDHWSTVSAPPQNNSVILTSPSAQPTEITSESASVGLSQSSSSMNFATTSGTGLPYTQTSPTGITGSSSVNDSSTTSLSWNSTVATWFSRNTDSLANSSTMTTSTGAAPTPPQATWTTDGTTQITTQPSPSSVQGTSTASGFLTGSMNQGSSQITSTTVAASDGSTGSVATTSARGTSGVATSAQGTSSTAGTTTGVVDSTAVQGTSSAQGTAPSGQGTSDVATTSQAPSGAATTTAQGTSGVATNTAIVPAIIWDSDSHSDSDPNCQPNDCVAECVSWRLLTFAAIKRPICPCIPRTCSKDDKGKKHGKCKLLGCGCGWMGLAFGPGCPGPEIDISSILPPNGLFGDNMCRFFGCPGNKDPGIIGSNGFCFGPGCDPCPAEICSGHGPQPGPNPTQPSSKPKDCEEKDKTRVTERFVYCTENFNFTVSEMPSSILGTTSTMISSVCVPMIQATIRACPGAMDGYTTTKTTTLARTATSSNAPACTKAPLSLDDDEGSNDDPLSTSTRYRSNTTSIVSSTQFSSSSAQESISSTQFSSSTETSASPTISASSSETLSASSTPGPMDRNGKWKAKITVSMEKTRSQLDWELFDPNGFSAGSDSHYADSDSWSVYIESKNRILEHSARYGVTMMLQGGLNVDTARVKFIIQKPMENCAYPDGNPCRPWMTTENRPEDQMFEVDSCEFNCKNRDDAKLIQEDVWCDDLNDSMWLPYNSGFRREFYCGWKGF